MCDPFQGRLCMNDDDDDDDDDGSGLGLLCCGCRVETQACRWPGGGGKNGSNEQLEVTRAANCRNCVNSKRVIVLQPCGVALMGLSALAINTQLCC